MLQREDVELKSLNAAVAMAGVLQCAIRSENKEAIAALIEHITDAKGPHAEHVENKETHLYTVIAEGRMLLMSFTTNHDAMETVHRTLPIFLYNSIMISEESPNMGLNLFEPRYQCMCERICSRQMPPFILFVPNFEDYQPKPGDCGFVVHVNCQPSGGGQYSMHGRLVTTRRVIELSWVFD